MSLRPSTPSRQPTTACRRERARHRHREPAEDERIALEGIDQERPDSARAIEQGPDELGPHRTVGAGEIGCRCPSVSGDIPSRDRTHDEAQAVAGHALGAAHEASRERMLLGMLVQPGGAARAASATPTGSGTLMPRSSSPGSPSATSSSPSSTRTDPLTPVTTARGRPSGGGRRNVTTAGPSTCAATTPQLYPPWPLSGGPQKRCSIKTSAVICGEAASSPRLPRPAPTRGRPPGG